MPDTIAIGPSRPEFASWRYLSEAVTHGLADCEVVSFREVPAACDLAVFIKWAPPPSLRSKIPAGVRRVYAPVDVYGSAAEIDGDAEWLTSCDRLVISCGRQERYFAPYAPVSFIEHPVSNAQPLRSEVVTSGPLLFVGSREHLPPLAQFANKHELPEELWVLTDTAHESCSAIDLGFSPRNRVRVAAWTPERQREWFAVARAGLDIKGEDFRARHKPATKTCEFLASGLPAAVNRGSSVFEHLQDFGLTLPAPTEFERWLSAAYAGEVLQVAPAIRAACAPETVGQAWRKLILRLLERPARSGRSAA